jgi:hypothetical protein
VQIAQSSSSSTSPACTTFDASAGWLVAVCASYESLIAFWSAVDSSGDEANCSFELLAACCWSVVVRHLGIDGGDDGPVAQPRSFGFCGVPGS